MIEIDRDASLVTIDGRQFPGVALICPTLPDAPGDSEEERALGAGGADKCVYIPAENGLLFDVEEHQNEHYHGISLWLYARTCQLATNGDEQMWLPWSIEWRDGLFIAGRSNCWSWAEPDWVVETIDRLSGKSFTQPEGPAVKLVRLNYFNETNKDTDENSSLR